MTNFKNTINRGTVSNIETNDKGKNFIKYRVFKSWIKDNFTGEYFPEGKKQTCKIYEGSRGWEQAVRILEKGADVLTIVGCIMTIPLITEKGESIILNRIALEEDNADLNDIFDMEIDYFREEELLDEETYKAMYIKKSSAPESENKGEDMKISEPTPVSGTLVPETQE